jgi:hypothetical protein
MLELLVKSVIATRAGHNGTHLYSIPAAQEVQVLSQSKDSLGKNMRLYLNNKLKPKGLWHGSSALSSTPRPAILFIWSMI